MQYIIFDLEATCWDKKPQGAISEIIEIGAVKLDSARNQVDTFGIFVKPSRHPALSDFCTQLTSITQDDVDSGVYFSQAMADFEEWIGSEPTTLLSWGRYDKKQLLEECEAKHYSGRILELLEHHRSLKHDFAEMKGIRLCGMKRALEILEIPLIGTHHRGMDDACNIARIFQAVYEEWSAFIRSKEA